MKLKILPFRKKHIIFWVSGVFYSLLFLLYFLVINYRHYYVSVCPMNRPWEVNFLLQECQHKYDNVIILNIEVLLCPLGSLGYCLLFIWSLIRGFLRFKQDNIKSFLPFLIQIIMGSFIYSLIVGHYITLVIE
jgi:hypothetical protein